MSDKKFFINEFEFRQQRYGKLAEMKRMRRIVENNGEKVFVVTPSFLAAEKKLLGITQQLSYDPEAMNAHDICPECKHHGFDHVYGRGCTWKNCDCKES